MSLESSKSWNKAKKIKLKKYYMHNSSRTQFKLASKKSPVSSTSRTKKRPPVYLEATNNWNFHVWSGSDRPPDLNRHLTYLNRPPSQLAKLSTFSASEYSPSLYYNLGHPQKIFKVYNFYYFMILIFWMVEAVIAFFSWYCKKYP